MSPNLGFSTGCFLQWKLPIPKFIRLLTRYDLNSLELSFLREEELFSFRNSSEIKNLLSSFDFVSIHAPDKRFIKSPEKDLIQELNKLADNLDIRNLVVHPDSFSNLDNLKANFEVLIENMPNKNNIFGNLTPAQLQSSHFVFDILHAFQSSEKDSDIDLLVRSMISSTKEVHASGFTKDLNHSLLVQSERVDMFGSILKKIFHSKPDIHYIFEGKIKPNDFDSIKKEIELMKTILE
ncbi:MAG: hypothetical protein ABIH83_01565 [Candidatus Micrarchaeota archaeon]